MNRWMAGALMAALMLSPNVASAVALDPFGFASLGVFNPGSNVTIDTSALTMTGGISATGVLSGGVAVFDFDSFVLGGGVTILVTGSNPLALLSQQDASVAGSIFLNGGNGSSDFLHPGGTGVAGGGNGGQSAGDPGLSGVGGGGDGGQSGSNNLTAFHGKAFGGGGGGGGGAFQFGAADLLDIAGQILAGGGLGSDGGRACGDLGCVGAQGGSGGGGGTIFLHAATLSLSNSALLDVAGGAGGQVDCTGTIDCLGPGAPGALGSIIIESGGITTPEPASIFLVACGLLGLAGAACRRCGRGTLGD